MSDAVEVLHACRETTTTRQEGTPASPVRTPDTEAPAPAGASRTQCLLDHIVAWLCSMAARCCCPMLTQQCQQMTYNTTSLTLGLLIASHHKRAEGLS
jgi:hypothetical protein